jgi:hypothetical protein
MNNALKERFDLNGGLDSVINITHSDLFPFFCECEVGETRYCISNDGAVVFYFQINDFAGFVKRIADNLTFQSTLQVYKLRQSGITQYWGCVKVYIDYSALKTSFFEFSKWFRGSTDCIKKIDAATGTIVGMIEELLCSGTGVQMLSPVRSVSKVHEFLLDCGVKEDEIVLKTVPCVDENRILRLGENRILGMFSLNDLSDIECSGVLNEFDYLQVFSVCVPSDKHLEDCREGFERMFYLVDGLNRDMDVDDDFRLKKVDSTRLCFYNNVLMFNADNKHFTKMLNDMRSVLLAHKLSVYVHTNVMTEQYISSFPGQAECSMFYQMDSVNDVVVNSERFLQL